MDWEALTLSLRLAWWTMLVLLPTGIVLGRLLAWRRFRGKVLVEAMLALPLVLPPTVLGYYLLVALGGTSPLGELYQNLTGRQLVFSFGGLLVASVVFNLPFAIQPMQRAFEAISQEVRDAAACCGLTLWRTLWRIELPLAWPGILSALVLTFAHTLGEFGVVLMVGGNIPGGNTHHRGLHLRSRAGFRRCRCGGNVRDLARNLPDRHFRHLFHKRPRRQARPWLTRD